MAARVLTPVVAKKIAAALRRNSRTTVEAASLDAGVSPNTVRLALKRFRDGVSSQDEDAPAAIIDRAIEHQCAKILRRGDALSRQGKSTAWQQWRLETKHPKSFGRKQAVELSGVDGGPVELASLSTEELMKLANSGGGEK